MSANAKATAKAIANPQFDAIEQRRLQALQDFGILDTPPEQSFDEISLLAASMFQVPVALVSLVDEQRQWFKSKVGTELSHTPRTNSFCSASIQSSDVTVVPDAQLDPRFKDHPMVTGEFGLRFYAGAPLVTAQGDILGTLCLIDTVPRELTPTQQAALAVLSRQVMAQMALRKEAAELACTRAVLDHDRAQLRQAQMKRRESERRLLFALESAEIGDWSMDLGTNVAMRSLQHDKCFGYTQAVEGWGYDTFLAHVDARDRERVNACYMEAMAGQGIYDVEFRVVWPDGSEHWLWSKGRFYFDQPGQAPCRVAGIQIDVTARKNAETLASNHAQRYQQLFEKSMDAVLQTRADGAVLSANPAACALFGLTEAQLCERGRAGLVDGEDLRLPHYLKVRAELGQVQGELRMRRGDGTLFDAELRSNIYTDADGQQLTSMLIRDITQLREQQRQLEHMAHFDALTGLPNRVLLADRLQQAMLQCQRHNQVLTVAFMDLDGFKQVNDAYGHAVGDQLLVKLAQRMMAELRDGETLARIGGDEFVAVLVDLDQAGDCEAVLNRLLLTIAQPLQIGDQSVRISVSIGVTVYPNDNSNAEQLVRHADQAMYAAKREGKNRYRTFDAVHDAALDSRRAQLSEVQHALDQQAFVLHYQPKVHMRTGRVIGVEALIRWQHPERGLLAPGLFLPWIENQPIDIALGEWVIASALQQMAQWRAAGVLIPVSVNISAQHLQTPDFAARLQTQLSAGGDLRGSYLELEVLETSALADIARVTDTMLACQQLGVRFALDDFGTGYSSLTYLKQLPAELLKIDQSFVRDMLVDKNDLAIVRGVVGLATAFGREVIAEGVETRAHGCALLELGCELAQGYGIARPMPAQDLAAWVIAWESTPQWIAD